MFSGKRLCLVTTRTSPSAAQPQLRTHNAKAGAAERTPAHNVKSPPKRSQGLPQRTATLPRAVKTKPNFIVAIVQTLQLEKIKQQFPNAENGAARLNLRTANTHTLPPSKPSNRKSPRDAVEVK